MDGRRAAIFTRNCAECGKKHGGWLGDKYAWRCEQCAIKAKERFEAMMQEDDRHLDYDGPNEDDGIVPPVTVTRIIAPWNG